ncbi:lysophospholipase [Brachybacterium sp. P6-10-X1]|uniref:alpha/beta hydrolase n=1 Tax=Brachybacterium sp. P6-10-X1 TaxID=1903186 RepID=UPI000971A906|nr:alpha/beta hydrolase [Brachybacterium sp. P6-10-X1]APX34337.1 lysophospholipase [Brachybacterium sp. P6-10-X1]
MIEDPVLGAGYTVRRLDLGADEEGPLVASLVHREPTGPRTHGARKTAARDARPPVLVMHGWSDYVFDRGLLEHLGKAGYDVWGLDLRKYGRSLLPDQTPTSVDHLSRYDREIGTALRIIGADRPPVLLAHSAGGLTAALWAQRRPGTVRALALNSPWLEMHLGSGVRTLARTPVRLLAEHLRARPILPEGSSHYSRALHRDFGGMYDYDLALKPARGHRFPAETLAAVLDGQTRLRAAGPLGIPVLVMHSARSRFGASFREGMRRADTVLDVHALARAARRLGPDVRVEPIEGARHDVFLSDADARARAIGILDDWLETLAP